MDLKKQLGEKIKRLRREKCYTQERFAEIIEIAPRNLINIENGANFPRSETLEKILSALGCTLENLFKTDHLASSDELEKEINNMVRTSKKDRKLLEKIYMVVRDITYKN